MATNRTRRTQGGPFTQRGIKAPVRLVTTENVTLEGTYTIGDVALAPGCRVLVAAQTDARENGIYVTSDTRWQRALDFNGNEEVQKGTLIPTEAGRLYYTIITSGTNTVAQIGVDLLGFAERVTTVDDGGGDPVTVEAPARFLQVLSPAESFKEISDGVWDRETFDIVVNIIEDLAVIATITVPVLLNTANGQISVDEDAASAQSADIGLIVINNNTTAPLVRFTDLTELYVEQVQLNSFERGQDGADAVGTPGAPGQNAVAYQFQLSPARQFFNGEGDPITMTVLRNDGGVLSVVDSGTVQIFNSADQPLGYSHTVQPSDIDNQASFFIRDGAGGLDLDTATISDVSDGAPILGVSTHEFDTWNELQGGAGWDPSNVSVDWQFLIYSRGALLASQPYRVTRNNAGELSFTTLAPIDPNITVTPQLSPNASVLTVLYSYVDDPQVFRVTFNARRAAQDGAPGTGVSLEPSVGAEATGTGSVTATLQHQARGSGLVRVRVRITAEQIDSGNPFTTSNPNPGSMVLRRDGGIINSVSLVGLYEPGQEGAEPRVWTFAGTIEYDDGGAGSSLVVYTADISSVGSSSIEAQITAIEEYEV